MNKIILGDCLEVMRGMADNSVDCVITDPPYGLDFKGMAWDKDIPKWLDEARRISPIVIFTTAPLTLWDYPKPDWVLCWYRDAASSRSLLGGGFNHWSPIVVYGKPKFQVDSIKLHAIANSMPKGYAHPSPKPVKLMKWLVSNATTEGQTILDPFAGSGATLKACKDLNRQYIGIEINPNYVKVAQDRLKQEVLL